MRAKVIIIMAMILTMLSGCNMTQEHVNESTIFVNRDGTIKSIVVEDFPQNTYDENDLKQMIHDDIWAYNNLHDVTDVRLISCEVESDTATVEIQYNSSSDYAEFNNRDFYFGTVSAALDAGYAKNVTLKNAHGVNTVSGSVINDMATYHMIVFDEDVKIQTYASVLYYSENLNILDDNIVARAKDARGLSYIIVK